MHSQHIPTIGVDIDENIDTGQNDCEPTHDDKEIETESISEHLPSNSEPSTELGNVQSEKLDDSHLKVPQYSPVNIEHSHSPASENVSAQDPSKLSTSWPLDVNVDLEYISEESPVNLALSSENPTKTSEKASTRSDEDSVRNDNLSLHGGNSSERSKQLSVHNESHSEQIENTLHQSDNSSLVNNNPEDKSDNLSLQSDNEALASGSASLQSDRDSAKSDQFLDSLNKESNDDSESLYSADKSNSLDKKDEVVDKVSSGSEDMIVLDIRGQGTPKFPFPTAKIIFGPPPEGSDVIDESAKPILAFPNLLSPFLAGAGDHVKIQEVLVNEPLREPSPDKSLDVTPDKSMSEKDKIEQSDLLIEEIIVNDGLKEKESDQKSDSTPPKSMHAEEASYSTLTTEYKTICEEFNAKVFVMNRICLCAWSLYGMILFCIFVLLLATIICYMLPFYNIHPVIYQYLSKSLSFWLL